MAYADATDLERYGLPPDALEEIDSDTKTAALEAASKVADGYLGSAFVLPITAHGEDLTRAVVAIAVYDLMTRRGYNPDGTDSNIRLRYEDAIRWLDRVAAGRLTPADIVDSTPEVFEGGSFVVSKAKRGW